MAFYQDISKYYQFIFPAGDEQVRFLKEVAGHPPKSVLDIACGAGEYSVELAKLGYQVTASDIDQEMIKQLETKVKEMDCPLKMLKADMLELNSLLNDKFNLVFCIGNSVVHLENLEQIRQFFRKARLMLETDGSLVVQIINFDRILLKEIKALPLIENKDIGLTFERYYNYDKEKNIIYFQTKLSVDGKIYENEIPLYPLLQDEITKAASEAGFKKIKLFGDFNASEYDKYNSYMLVLWAR